MILLYSFRGSLQTESLVVTDTYQFDDYSKYIAPGMDVEAKAKRREEQFPKDCQKAYQMGARFVQNFYGIAEGVK